MSINNGFPYLLNEMPPSTYVMISGSVTSSLNTPMENVTMSFTNGVATVYTNASGIYSQSVLDNWTGSLEPTASGYDFFIDYGVSGSYSFGTSSVDRTLNWIGVKDFSSGDGTVNNPWLIFDHEDMHNVRYRTGSYDFTKNAFYALGSDIDLSPISEWLPINHINKGFYGAFQGNGYTINNLNISFVQPQYDIPSRILYFGLFGYISPPTSASFTIGNFTLNSCSIDMLNGLTAITSTPHYGLFCAYYNSSVPLTNIKIKNSTLRHNRTSGANQHWFAGGLYGHGAAGATSCSIESSVVEFNVTTFTSNQPEVGLLVGNGGAFTFRYCYAKDSYLNTNRNGFPTFNGFFGSPSAVAYDCYVLNCIISGTKWVSPFASGMDAVSTRNYVAKIDYGNTPIAQRFPFYYYSGMAGNFNYWESGSLELVNTGSAYTTGITGSTSESMQDSASYITWDFENVWNEKNLVNYSYPFFDFERLPYPELKIIRPNGGEVYLFNEMIPISWSFA